jgi:hypothetical protein
MIKRTAILFTAALALTTFSGTALAADQLRDRDKDQIQDKLKDGSCKQFSSETPAALILAADQLRDRIQDPIKDKLQDGSCKGFSAEISA